MGYYFQSRSHQVALCCHHAPLSTLSNAHTGNRAPVTSMGGLYDTATLCVLDRDSESEEVRQCYTIDLCFTPHLAFDPLAQHELLGFTSHSCRKHSSAACAGNQRLGGEGEGNLKNHVFAPPTPLPPLPLWVAKIEVESCEMWNSLWRIVIHLAHHMT